MRTLVTFFSKKFNASEVRDYYINPHCFGDDVCRWLIGQLQQSGVDVDEAPQQEDFGWYFNFRLPVGRFCFIVSCRPEENEEEALWIGWIERQCGLLGSVLGHRLKNISVHAVDTVSRILRHSPEVTGVLWHNHETFLRGLEQSGAESPHD